MKYKVCNMKMCVYNMKMTVCSRETTTCLMMVHYCIDELPIQILKSITCYYMIGLKYIFLPEGFC